MMVLYNACTTVKLCKKMRMQNNVQVHSGTNHIRQQHHSAQSSSNQLLSPLRTRIAPPPLLISISYTLSGSPSSGTSYHHFIFCPSTAHRPPFILTSTFTTSRSPSSTGVPSIPARRLGVRLTAVTLVPREYEASNTGNEGENCCPGWIFLRLILDALSEPSWLKLPLLFASTSATPRASNRSRS